MAYLIGQLGGEIPMPGGIGAFGGGLIGALTVYAPGRTLPPPPLSSTSWESESPSLIPAGVARPQDSANSHISAMSRSSTRGSWQMANAGRSAVVVRTLPTMGSTPAQHRPCRTAEAAVVCVSRRAQRRSHCRVGRCDHRPRMGNDRLKGARGGKPQTTEAATRVPSLLKETADALEHSARLAEREVRRKEDAGQDDVAARERQAGRQAHEAAQRALSLAADLSFAVEAMAQEERRRAVENESGASERRFRVAAEAMLDALAILSPVRVRGGEIVDFRLRYVNDACCELLGFERARLLGRRVGEVFAPFAGSEQFEVYRRVAVTGESYRGEEVQLPSAWAGTALGSRVFDTVIASMGEELVVSARDVTERKQDEQELELRAELLDLAHDAVIVRDPVDSRVTFWNRGAEAIYGYSRAEAIDRGTHELLATVFPDSEEAVGEALGREGRWVGELRHTRKDGEVIVVSSRQALQRGDDGRPIAIIELNSDISERKRVEEELAHLTVLLERTEELTKTGGWEYDLVTGTTTWTDEVYRVVGLDRGSHPPEPAQALAAYDAESAPLIDAAFRRLVADGQAWDLELGLLRGDGQRIWVRVIGRPKIERGEVVGVTGTISDVSDRRRAEEEIRTLNAELEQRVAARTAELERSNRELETFAYSVSHDLRAPLRAVNAFSQLACDEGADEVSEQVRHYLERVRVEAVRMGELIDAVLQLSRLSRRPMTRVPVDLSALASEIVAELQTADPDRRVEVEIEGGLVAEADLELVRSVLQNLLANAYKFTAHTPHPRVRFGAVENNGVPVYFVADNGAGFDKAHAKRLFLPFHRLHQDREFPGEGIGLATVVRAVHRHGGVVWAHGTVNQGARFCFSLIPGAHPPTDAATAEDVIPAWQSTDQGTADE